MQRPVMNPNFYEDAPGSFGARRRPFRALAMLVWKGIRKAFKLLSYDPLSRIPGFRYEEGTPTSRFLRGLFYRLAFAPVFIAAVSCAVVWTGTHPRSVVSEIDPVSQGIYYEVVTYVGADQIPIEGWLMPVIDAKAVLQEKERVLFAKRPAVVLVHDFGQRREQVLPMIKPLHDAGYVVLAMNLRGGGPKAVSGETFGLQESIDVKNGIELLRRRPFVDPKRVAIVGFGTGASAALLAAATDPQIVAVVAYNPMKDSDEVIRNRIVPQSPMLSWMAPLCKWTFEMSYGVDIDELSALNFKRLFDTRPVLMIDSGRSYADLAEANNIERIRSFLESSIPKRDGVARVQHDSVAP